MRDNDGRNLGVIEPEQVDTITGEVLERSNALVRREMVSGLIRPAAPINEVIQLQNDTRALIQQTLVKGRDYGRDHGGDKDSLYKAGAERINAAFAVYPRYEIMEKEIDHDRPVHYTKRKKKWRDRQFAGWEVVEGDSVGLYRYVVSCELIHRASGMVIGHGLAECSTMESKYVDRPRDMGNTVLKMAEKRAHVAATLNAFGLSDQFTQDVEDFADKEPQGDHAPAAPARQQRTAPKPRAAQQREPGSDDVPVEASGEQIAEIRYLLTQHYVNVPKRELLEQELDRGGLLAERANIVIPWLKAQPLLAE